MNFIKLQKILLLGVLLFFEISIFSLQALPPMWEESEKAKEKQEKASEMEEARKREITSENETLSYDVSDQRSTPYQIEFDKLSIDKKNFIEVFREAKEKWALFSEAIKNFKYNQTEENLIAAADAAAHAADAARHAADAVRHAAGAARHAADAADAADAARYPAAAARHAADAARHAAGAAVAGTTHNAADAARYADAAARYAARYAADAGRYAADAANAAENAWHLSSRFLALSRSIHFFDQTFLELIYWSKEAAQEAADFAKAAIKFKENQKLTDVKRHALQDALATAKSTPTVALKTVGNTESIAVIQQRALSEKVKIFEHERQDNVSKAKLKPDEALNNLLSAEFEKISLLDFSEETLQEQLEQAETEKAIWEEDDVLWAARPSEEESKEHEEKALKALEQWQYQADFYSNAAGEMRRSNKQKEKLKKLVAACYQVIVAASKARMDELIALKNDDSNNSVNSWRSRLSFYEELVDQYAHSEEKKETVAIGSLSEDDRRRYPDAQLVAIGEYENPKTHLKNNVRIIKTSLETPYVRVEEEVDSNGATLNCLRMLADRLSVILPEGENVETFYARLKPLLDSGKVTLSCKIRPRRYELYFEPTVQSLPEILETSRALGFHCDPITISSKLHVANDYNDYYKRVGSE